MIFCPNVHSGHMLHGRHLAYVQWFTTPEGPQKDNICLSNLTALTASLMADWGGGSMFLGLKFLKKNLRVFGIKKVLQKQLLSCIFSKHAIPFQLFLSLTMLYNCSFPYLSSSCLLLLAHSQNTL